MAKDVVYLENVTVDFSGFKALNNVSFWVRNGELRFLIGPNGAGKTTLLDVICGRVQPAEGRVFFDDRAMEIRHIQPHRVARSGISRKFQTPSVFGKLTVWENLELSLPKNRAVFESLAHRLDARDREQIETALEQTGLTPLRGTPAERLSHGQKQWLELGMTMVQSPKLLLVDEPVAGMTQDERMRTGRMLAELARERSVLVVEHDMHFVETFSSTVTVLHEGQVLCEGAFAKVSRDPRVLEVYLGRAGEGA
jgi:urea transport system ATP-binding protein